MEDNKNKNEIRIVNLSNYERPQIIETVGREWVKYGIDNDYYTYLINRYVGSVTNSAVINGISDMIYGNGLKARDAHLKPEAWANLKSVLNKSTLKKVILDYKLLGIGFLQVIYNGDHSKIVEAYHVPSQHLRAEKVNEDGDIDGYYFSTDWTKIYGKNKPTRIPAFGTSKEGLELIAIRNYVPGSFYYTPPDYQAGLAYAELEEEIANYHINNIKNGFAPSTIINFNNGQASTDEAKKAIEQKVNEKFSGVTGKKIILSFNDSAEKETTIETIQLSDASEQYQFLSTEASTKVMVAHRVTSPMLFGISTANGFASNADELKNASLFMANTVIAPFRDTLIDAVDGIMTFNDISLDVYFEDATPWVSEKEELEEEQTETKN